MSTAIQEQPTKKQMLANIGNKAKAPAARIQSVGKLMEAAAGDMFRALPKHITPDRMIAVTLSSLRKNPALLDCDAASLMQAITEAARLGLVLDGVLGHAYLVPFKNECTMVPGYKGLIDLARRTGTISTIVMEVVHEGDDFDFGLGDTPFIHHRPSDEADRDDQPITHVYVVVTLRDGGKQRSVWSTPKINRHRDQYSKGHTRKDSPWNTNWQAMAKKTVMREMINRGLIPVSAELAKPLSQEELIERQTVEAPARRVVNNLESLLTDQSGSDFDETVQEEAPEDVAQEEPPEDHNQEEVLTADTEEYIAALKQATNIGECEELYQEFRKRCESDDDEIFASELANKRKDEIRSTRGSRSN